MLPAGSSNLTVAKVSLGKVTTLLGWNKKKHVWLMNKVLKMLVRSLFKKNWNGLSKILKAVKLSLRLVWLVLKSSIVLNTKSVMKPTNSLFRLGHALGIRCSKLNTFARATMAVL